MSDAFPRGIEVCVAALVVKGNKLLVIRSPKWENKLAFPGGHVDAGETLQAAAAREALEETGIQSEPLAVLGWGESINPPQYHRPIHLLFFDVVCRYTGGEIQVQADEVTEALWLSVDELRQAELIDLDKPMLDRYQEWKESSV